MQNKLSSIGAELGKDRIKGLEMRELNHIAKGTVKLMQRVKIAHSFLQFVSNLFHFIILILPM